MKPTKFVTVILSTSILTVVAAGADDEVPKPFKFDRYQKMLDHSPFAVASIVVAQATPDFAKGLYVANAAKAPDGEVMATIMSSDDKNFKEYATTGKPNEHGWSVSSVEWSEVPGATKVTISKDGKFATLTFNQALVTSQLPGGPLGFQPPQQYPQPAFPQVTPMSGGFPKPPARIQSLPTPVPHTRPVIPRNPQTQLQQPAQPVPDAQ
jgi:hypothetical protein